MPKLDVVNIEGKKTETLDLPDSLFGQKVNTYVLHQAVVMYQACLRQGTVSTKERAYVSGGGKKPFRQKGTGRARAGSIRSPLWHGGGITFGPHPRDFSYSIPKKIKKVALRESLNDKYVSKDMLCLEDINIDSPKTKEFAKVLKKLKLSGKILALFDGCNENVVLASRNIADLNLVRGEDVNAYDVLRNKKILLTKSAMKKLLKRIQ